MKGIGEAGRAVAAEEVAEEVGGVMAMEATVEGVTAMEAAVEA